MADGQPPKITIVRDGNLAVFKRAYLPAAWFPSFTKAMEGVRYERDARARAVPLDRVAPVIRRLGQAGFAVRVDPELRTHLQKKKLRHWYELQAVEDRIRRIDAEIFARTGNHLFPYQCYGAMWLTQRSTALLADEMGLGKTLACIVAIPANAPTLVVVPASLKYEWLDEIKRWRPQLHAVVLSGRDSFRWPREGEILITNYDVLPDVHDRAGKKGPRCDGQLPAEPCPGCKEVLKFTRDGVTTVREGHEPTCKGFLKRKPCYGCHPLLDEAPPHAVMIGDELQKVKGGTSQRAIKYGALANAVRRQEGGRTWGVTGTPMENDPKELWYVMKACGVAEECFGDWDTFCRVFRSKALDYGAYEWGTPDASVVERLQRGTLRRMVRDVQPELPTAIWKEVTVEIDRASVQKFDAFLKSFPGGVERLATLLEQEKVPFEQMSAVRAALATAKLPAVLNYLRDFLDDYKEPVIVYSVHRAPIDTVGKLKGWEVIHGETPLEARRDIVKRFQAGKIRGLGVTIQAAGVGLTLTRSCRGFFVDLSYNPKQNEQAAARQLRIGQKNNVMYTVFKANHVLDQRQTEILIKKCRVSALSVDAASVSDDAPMDKLKREFEDDIREMQDAIATGRAVRRGPEAEEERRALDDLHHLTFQSASDDRLAVELAEEAESIGLSDKQWRLAITIASRGVRRSPESEDVSASVQKEERSAGIPEREEVEEASPIAPSSSEREKDESMTEHTPDADESDTVVQTPRIKDTVKRIVAMPIAERADFLSALEDTICMACASSDHLSTDCPDGDFESDNEDEDVDVDDEDDEGEEDGDDGDEEDEETGS
jgi:hypothetical protein